MTLWVQVDRFWRNECPSGKHLCDCVDEIGGHPRFRYVRVASCCEATGDVIEVSRHTEEDYLRFAARDIETHCYLGPIENRHRKIQDKNIWHEFIGRFNRGLSVPDARNYIKVAAKDADNPRAHSWMILGDY